MEEQAGEIFGGAAALARCQRRAKGADADLEPVEQVPHRLGSDQGSGRDGRGDPGLPDPDRRPAMNRRSNRSAVGVPESIVIPGRRAVPEQAMAPDSDEHYYIKNLPDFKSNTLCKS
jgi:hypothetical protein